MNWYRAVVLTLLAFTAGCASDSEALRFARQAEISESAVAFQWQSPSDPYLNELRTRYDLDRVLSGSRTDYERVVAITQWTHQRWTHSVTHAAINDDPLSILKAAAHGERFRCTEYSIVAAGALNSIGIPARIVFLDVRSTIKKILGVGGHVATEAYLRDEGKWVMLDAQWGAVPLLQGRPLNAVEFQAGIADEVEGLEIAGLSETGAGEYVKWIAPYLYSFTVRLDNRLGVTPRLSGFLSLVPVGAPAGDKRFTYTNSPEVFYRPPAAAHAAPNKALQSDAAVSRLRG